MEQGILIELIELIILLALTAFFAGTETAFFSLTRKQVHDHRESKSIIGSLIAVIAGSPRSLLATVLLGNMITSVLFSSMAYVFARHILGPDRHSSTLIFINAGLLFALIVFGEVVPKTVAVRVPVAFARLVAVPFFFMQQAMTPAIRLHRAAAGRKADKHPAHGALSAQELKQILASGARGGEFGKRLSRLVSEIMDFREIKVREVMVPRVDVIAFKKTDSMDALIALITEKKVKNIPVFGHYKDDVVGLVSAKDVFASSANDPADLIRPVLVVPENKSIESMLIEFQRQHQKFAVVVNEYGAMEGIVTIEDILEEIVGEIEDEFDPRKRRMRPVGRLETEVPGDMVLRDFNEIFSTSLTAEGIDTIGGYLAARLGAIPKIGDKVSEGTIVMTVKEARKNRVTLIIVQRAPW